MSRHQPRDTSFLDRLVDCWELSFVVRFLDAARVDLAAVGLAFCVVEDGRDAVLVGRVAFFAAASLAARASLRSRLLRWSAFSLGFMLSRDSFSVDGIRP